MRIAGWRVAVALTAVSGTAGCPGTVVVDGDPAANALLAVAPACGSHAGSCALPGGCIDVASDHAPQVDAEATTCRDNHWCWSAATCATRGAWKVGCQQPLPAGGCRVIWSTTALGTLQAEQPPGEPWCQGGAILGSTR